MLIDKCVKGLKWLRVALRQRLLSGFAARSKTTMAGPPIEGMVGSCALHIDDVIEVIGQVSESGRNDRAYCLALHQEVASRAL